MIFKIPTLVTYKSFRKDNCTSTQATHNTSSDTFINQNSSSVYCATTRCLAFSTWHAVTITDWDLAWHLHAWHSVHDTYMHDTQCMTISAWHSVHDTQCMTSQGVTYCMTSQGVTYCMTSQGVTLHDTYMHDVSRRDILHDVSRCDIAWHLYAWLLKVWHIAWPRTTRRHSARQIKSHDIYCMLFIVQCPTTCAL